MEDGTALSVAQEIEFQRWHEVPQDLPLSGREKHRVRGALTGKPGLGAAAPMHREEEETPIAIRGCTPLTSLV